MKIVLVIWNWMHTQKCSKWRGNLNVKFLFLGSLFSQIPSIFWTKFLKFMLKTTINPGKVLKNLNRWQEPFKISKKTMTRAVFHLWYLKLLRKRFENRFQKTFYFKTQRLLNLQEFFPTIILSLLRKFSFSHKKNHN